MASIQPVRMIVTKAQRADEGNQRETTAMLQRSYTAATATTVATRNQIPYTLPSAPTSQVFTPPPQYQEPPANLRPMYYEGKDLKQSMSVHDYYPPHAAAPDPSNWSPSRAKLPFWRTKKGIVLIVLLSNIVIIAIVLGVVFATRNHNSTTDSAANPAGDNSEGSLSSTNQDGIPSVSSSPSSSSSTSSSTSSFSSSSPPSSSSTSSASATMASMMPLFSAVAPSPGGGTTGPGADVKPNPGGGNPRVANLANQAKAS